MNAINSISSSATTSGTAGSVQTQARPIISTPSVTANSNDVKQAAQQQETAIGKEEVKQLVEQANMQLAGASNQRVSFGYEERLNLLYVQIKDSATGEVVREIPPKELIEQRAALSEMIGMILDRNA